MIPREFMPQVDEEDYPALWEYLKEQGIPVRWRCYRPHDLGSAQENNPEALWRVTPRNARKPLLVSRCGVVIDGNTRLMHHLRFNTPWVGCYTVWRYFPEAIKVICAFPRAYEYGDGKPHPEKY